jgi:hypothetical protein
MSASSLLSSGALMIVSNNSIENIVKGASATLTPLTSELLAFNQSTITLENNTQISGSQYLDDLNNNINNIAAAILSVQALGPTTTLSNAAEFSSKMVIGSSISPPLIITTLSSKQNLQVLAYNLYITSYRKGTKLTSKQSKQIYLFAVDIYNVLVATS